jgi:hypothetical protein
MVPERHPILEDDSEAESEPQPATESAGGVRPPGRIGGGLEDYDGSDEPPNQPPSPEQLGDWRNLAIEDLHLSMRAYNTLRRSGIVTLGGIISIRPEELLTVLGRGKALEDVREGVDDVLKSGLWRSYRDYGLISSWVEAAVDAIRHSQS